MLNVGGRLRGGAGVSAGAGSGAGASIGLAAAGGKAAYETVKDQASKAREQTVRAAEAVGEEIEARPLTSVAIAFGLGFLVGKLLERR